MTVESDAYNSADTFRKLSTEELKNLLSEGTLDADATKMVKRHDSLRKRHDRYLLMKKLAPLGSIFGSCILSLLLVPVPSSAQQSKPECQTQTGANFSALMCLARGQAMQHDLYSLVVDRALIFTLTDDFSEDVHLKHTIPPGVTLEHPLSRAAGSNTVEITGGCVPESKDGMEVARVCNFSWGGTQVVKDVRFTFD